MNVVVIPAYKPNGVLVKLVQDLLSLAFTEIIVVDDGNSEEYQPLFLHLKNLGCVVCVHDVNCGKGAALKTGIRYAYENIPNLTGYITCDADGQHLPADVQRLALALVKHPTSLILGVRDFKMKDVPFKSRWGNRISAMFFRLICGASCPDTQTGLRAIPKCLTDLALSISENRYDYEMIFLTTAVQQNKKWGMVRITTVYEEGNASSHFNAITDSFRIYRKPFFGIIAKLMYVLIDLCGFAFLISSQTTSFLTILWASVLSRIGALLLYNAFKYFVHFRTMNVNGKYIIYNAIQVVVSAVLVFILSFTSLILVVDKLIIDTLLLAIVFFVIHGFLNNRRGGELYE